MTQASNPDSDVFINHLDNIAQEDAAGLKESQKCYGNSWKKRGGIGAYMMLARKWDRMEKRVGQTPELSLDDSHPDGLGGALRLAGDRFDIFQHLAADDRAEGIIDDVRDLRRYLMLIEAEARAMCVTSAFTKHRDAPREEHTTHGGEELMS